MSKIHETDAPVKVWFWRRKAFRNDLEKAALKLEAVHTGVLGIDFCEHKRRFTSTFYITIKGTVRGINAFAKGLNA